MRVLFIDDDQAGRNTFVQWFKEKYGYKNDITSVDNLVDFDAILYEDPDNLNFDKIIMDLRIDAIMDFDPEQYNLWLQSLDITEHTKINNDTEIIGWDYFVKVIRDRDLTKNCLDRFMLKSGYGDLVRDKIDISLLGDAVLLTKGEKDYESKLTEFMERR